MVLGVGKTGTTALYFRIKNSLGSDALGLFEPPEFAPIADALGSQADIVGKVLLPLDERYLARIGESFHHKVLTIRDPRDVVVSALLYTGAYEYVWRRGEAEIRTCLESLKRKEDRPESLSVLRLLEGMWDGFSQDAFSDLARASMGALASLSEQPGYFPIRYEDLIHNRLAGLESYLELPLTEGSEVDAEFSRVARTKGSGSWRDWYTGEDLAYFEPLFRDFLRRFGYDAGDWELNHPQRILPEHASGYVRRVVNERRQRDGLGSV
jgi:hypothetical protein